MPHSATKPKGHWPLGKRRKPPTGTDVTRAIKASVKQRGLRATARLLGVSPRTVGRWARRERYPDAAEVRVILALETMP